MLSRPQTLAVGVLLALIQNSSFAELSASGKVLLEQGQYWQARKDRDRATEAWRKLLRIDPQQVDAIYGLGMLELDASRIQGAKRYLDQLQQFHPGARQTLLLQQEIALHGNTNAERLQLARQLAESGELDQAVVAYRSLFDGKLPQGQLGLEFYSYLGYTSGGWREARQGLERLLSLSPDNAKVKLNLAKLLLRNESTRTEGIRRLASYATHPEIGSEAIEDWRQGLTWLGVPRPAELPLFEAFLRTHPQDQEIRDLMNKGRQQSAGGGWQQDPLVTSGLRALEKGDQSAAEKAFQTRLASSPDDSDALGGLGVLRQQQNRYAEAEQLLTRAVSKGGRQWRAALEDVRYWSLLQQGRDLQAKGQTARAQEVIAEAIRLNPKSVDGHLALADIQVQAGQFDNATSNYRHVLAAQRGNPQAIRGLVEVLSQTGQADEALRLLDGLSPAEQAKFGNTGRLRSLRFTQLAGIAEQRGDIRGAQNALLDAVKEDPDNAWTRFSLARLYVRTGESQKARDLIDAFIKTHPDNLDALYTSALLAVEMEQWTEAQTAINRIPLERRTAVMNDLADQIALTTQVNLATSIARRGQRQEALGLLDRLQPMASGNPERTATLASAYVDAGDAEHAQSMMRSLLAQSSAPSADLMLQHASILLKTGDDAQVHAILQSLQNQSLNAATRKRYDDLLYLYRVRQADRLREGGDLASAYDTLAPALAQRPGDVAATSALARMYTTNGEHAKAFELYKPLLQRNPKDSALLLNTADAAVLAHDNAYAEDALDRFLKLQSIDPQSLTEAARIYRAMGKANKATELLRMAVAIEQSEKQHSLDRQASTLNVAPNPFRGQSGQRSQLARAPASAIPPPAETILGNGAATAVAGGLPAGTYRGAQIRSGTAAASVYPLPQIPAAPAVNVAQGDPLIPQSSSRTAMPIADSASSAQSALNNILQTRAAYVAQGVDIRSNDSEPGLSKLTDVETPFEVNIPVGEGRVALRITPVELNAGSMNSEAATRFGIGLIDTGGIGSQRDRGVGLGVAYARQDAGFKIDIGTTPLGFEYQNVVGGVSIERPLEDNSNFRYGITLSRRAVTDSLTSFAGTSIAHNVSRSEIANIISSRTGTSVGEDDIINKSWGGVTANGGRVQLSYDDTEVGVYTYGALHRLLGHNVKSNTRVELGGGAYRYLRNVKDSTLSAGLSATVLHYSNNQNFFTFGHGGYFSPQSYLALGVPVIWSQRSDRFTYQLKGSVGLQYFQQDGADYFPEDPTAQALFGKRYDEQSSSGLGYNLEAAGEYRFASKLFVGGRFALDNSRDYRQYNVGMYIRYAFENMTGSAMALPVSPYRSPYSN